jgi:hypothetical protein
MKLPERIIVGPYTYTMERVARLCNADHRRLLGEQDAGAFVIRLDEGLAPQRERVVILHELLHAIEDERTMDFSEEQVNQLAHALANLLLDNPDLTRLFLAEATQ